ncbi:7930_t:CDS:2, partial [Acaulospora morrowiae]
TAVIAPKIDPSIPIPKRPKEKTDRDFIEQVLRTFPSKREAQSYINRFKISLSPAENEHHQQNIPGQEQSEQESTKSSIQQKSQFVDSLFTSRFEHVALIKIQGPLPALDIKSVAKTLVYLQKLGLMSIVVLDNDEWKEMLKEGPSRFNELRRWMVDNAASISDAIENVGGRAVPIYNGVFTLTNGSEKEDKKPYRHRFPKRILLTDVGARVNVSLCLLKSCLRLGQIPLILPIALDGLSMQRVISPNTGIVELSRALSDQSNANLLELKTPQIEPMKIIVINSEGGIPSEERRGSHVFINIQQEYEDIIRSFKLNPQWKFTHPTSLENFEMIKTCLEKLPSTTSAIMVPAFSPAGLISNLITDKPLFSSSLPLEASSTHSTSTTVLRYGAPVFFHDSLDTVNISSLKYLIEKSFERKLNFDKYLSRVKDCINKIIVVGDFQGAAVVTMEKVEADEKGIPYLDKFSVAPNAQGTGTADILWKQLKIMHPNLMWRSRVDNGVNKWYFERSDGYFRVPGTNWIMFWCGMEGIYRLKSYIEVVQSIPPSFF